MFPFQLISGDGVRVRKKEMVQQGSGACRVLFDMLRRWAYTAVKPSCLDVWQGQVLEKARGLVLELGLGETLGAEDVSRTARDVGVWVWRRRGQFGCRGGFSRQRQRQLTRWYGRKQAVETAVFDARDAEIGRLAVEEKVPVPDLVARYGLSRSQVCRLVRRFREGLEKGVEGESY